MNLLKGSYFNTCLLLLCALVNFQCTHSKKTTTPNSFSSSAEDPSKFSYYFIEGCKERLKGNLDVAEKLFFQCLTINPNSAPVKYELANIKKNNHQNNLALKYSKECALADEKNEWYQLVYVECLQNVKQYTQAAEVYNKLIKNFPERADFYEAQATEYIYAQNFEKALSVYEEFETKFGQNESTSLNKIKLLKTLNKKAETEKALKKLIQFKPQESRYYSYLAEFYQEINQNEKAFLIYQDALKIDSKNPMIHLAIADYYKNINDKENFYKELKLAFENTDLDIETKQKILISYYQLSEENESYKKQALELCEITLRNHSQSAVAHTIFADFLYRDKKLKEAKDEYEKAILLDKSKFVIWNQLMYIESELNQNEKLESHSFEAMDLFPNQATPYFFNGIANIQLKNYSKAIQSLNDGLEFVYNDKAFVVQFYYNLGDAYNSVKEFDKSDKAFDEALKVEPDNSYVLNNYAYYLSLRKNNLEKAEKYSKRSNQLEPNNRSYIDTYGWILFQLQKYNEAEEWLSKAAKMGAKNAVILEHYGDVLFKLNKTENALYYWNEAKSAGKSSDILDKKIKEKKLYE